MACKRCGGSGAVQPAAPTFAAALAPTSGDSLASVTVIEPGDQTVRICLPCLLCWLLVLLLFTDRKGK